MHIKKMLRIGIAAAAFAGFSGNVFAAICGSSLDTTDVSFLRLDQTSPLVNATSCIGASDLPNSKPLTVTNYVNTAWSGGTPFTDVIRDENRFLGSDSGGLTGIFNTWKFSLNAIGGNVGAFTLNISDTNGATNPNLPHVFDIVIALSGGSYTAAYLFDDLLFKPNFLNPINSTNLGTFEINFKNNGGRYPNLSHMDILVRDGNNGPSNDVPEPGSIALLGVGMLALRRFMKKREPLNRYLADQ